MAKKNDANKDEEQIDQPDDSQHKNKPLRIPLNFDKAVEGLLNVKPQKKKSQTENGGDAAGARQDA